MTKKISLGITIGLIIVSIVVSSLVTVFVLLGSYEKLFVDLPDKAHQYDKLSEMDELIRQEYYGDFDETIIDSSLASGFVEGLEDPYSYYISADNIKVYTDYLQGKLPGTGISSYYDSESNSLIISFVDENSPAKTAGIKTGFYINSVSGVSVSQENASELSLKLTDGYDTKIKFSYFEEVSSADSPIDVELVCGYRQPSCEYNFNGNVGYVHFSSFYDDTYADFSSAIEQFKANNISALIIDVRNCSGNDFEAAAKVIDLIVPVASEGTGALFTAKNAEDEILSNYPSDANSLNMSVAVLINSRTESAAELLACDLRDFGKGVLIGETTAGHGTMQKMFNMKDGGAVSLTVAEIYPYISDSFDGVGVTPDYEILTSESFKNKLDFSDFSSDEQYNKAYSYLTGQ